VVNNKSIGYYVYTTTDRCTKRSHDFLGIEPFTICMCIYIVCCSRRDYLLLSCFDISSLNRLYYKTFFPKIKGRLDFFYSSSDLAFCTLFHWALCTYQLYLGKTCDLWFDSSIPCPQLISLVYFVYPLVGSPSTVLFDLLASY